MRALGALGIFAAVAAAVPVASESPTGEEEQTTVSYYDENDQRWKELAIDSNINIESIPIPVGGTSGGELAPVSAPVIVTNPPPPGGAIPINLPVSHAESIPIPVPPAAFEASSADEEDSEDNLQADEGATPAKNQAFEDPPVENAPSKTGPPGGLPADKASSGTSDDESDESDESEESEESEEHKESTPERLFNSFTEGVSGKLGEEVMSVSLGWLVPKLIDWWEQFPGNLPIFIPPIAVPLPLPTEMPPVEPPPLQ